MYIQRRPSGRWYAQYRDRAGKRHGRTFERKLDAQRWAAEQERLVARIGGYDPRAARQLVADYEAHWWANRVVEATTAATDRGRLDNHVLPEFGQLPLDVVTTSAVQGWVRKLSKDGLAPATVRSCHRLLASMLGAAVRDGLLHTNPATGVILPAVGDGREVYLAREEVDAVAEQMHSDFDRAVLYTLAYTGMRWGEVAGLHAGRLDLLRRRVEVVEVLSEVGGARTVKPYPKGKRRRTVPIPALLVDVLAAHLAAYPASREELVFRPKATGALSRHTWGRWKFKTAVRAALGRDDVLVHDLRHSYASWLAQAGVPLYEVQMILGHRSITTTQRYAHLVPDVFDRALGALDGSSRFASGLKSDVSQQFR